MENENFASSNQVSPRPSVSGRRFSLIVGLVLLVGLIVAFIALTAAVYLLPINDSFVRKVASVVPYPAVAVNGVPIFFKEFYQEWDAYQTYLQQQPDRAGADMANEEVQTRVLDTMIDREIVQQLANQYLIKLDENKVKETLDNFIAQSASEEQFFSDIKTNFGWEKEAFVARVVEPMVLSSQVEEKILADENLQKDARKKIDEALTRLKNNEAFSTVAGEINDDSSAGNGGDLGFISVDSLPAEVLTFLNTNPLNTFSEVLDLQSFYSIVMASDKVEGENGTQYALHIIIVSKKGLSEVINNFMSYSKVWKFSRT